jgi:hypothetical protein
MIDVTEYISLEEVTGPGLVYPPGVLDLVTASWPLIRPVVVKAAPGVQKLRFGPSWFAGCVYGLWLTVSANGIHEVLAETGKWQAASITFNMADTNFAEFVIAWANIGEEQDGPIWDVPRAIGP